MLGIVDVVSKCVVGKHKRSLSVAYYISAACFISDCLWFAGDFIIALH